MRTRGCDDRRAVHGGCGWEAWRDLEKKEEIKIFTSILKREGREMRAQDDITEFTEEIKKIFKILKENNNKKVE